ncbi:hypothetical protein YPPY95_2154, partial [Yersinia pestis PY-95]
MANQSTWG